MARQYDIEDLLNSDASDPDGEPTPAATNDEVQEGKVIIETAAGTGKLGDVSQIVADYLKKSAGFYTSIRPYYIVRPATGQAWTGTWQIFLHGIDDAGLSDAVNISIGINGVVVHTAAWSVSSGTRVIEFSINATESAALVASPPSGGFALCYVAFHDTDGHDIVIRHFALQLLAAVPKIPDDEIPNDIARDNEVTQAIATALAAHPGAFSDSIDLGTYENANGGAIDGHYVRISSTQVDISHRNIANEDKSTEINAIEVGFGLVFGEKIFVVEWTNQNSGYRAFNGFWAGDDPDATAESSQISIKVIEHELRMIRFMTAAQLKKLLPEIQQAFDKTVDIHLLERPGDFVNMNDAAVAGIALIQNTTANRNALNARTYNFAGLTWQTTTVDIPDDGNDYWVVVRIARALGNIETQFQFLSSDPEAGIEHLRFSRQGDDTWHYYQVVADTESVWTMQRRGTATHTRFDGPLGDVPVRQVQALIPDIPENEGLTPQQKAQFESLVAKTADLLIETRETWVAATDASFLALPADNAQLARVRAGNTPQGLTGWTTDITTTDARVVLIRVPTAAQLADYRILLGDDNAVRLDTYAVNAIGTQYAYMTSTSLILQEASRIRLQHHGNATHTRFIGMLADAIMARLLPMLPDADDRDGKVPQFSGNDLVWQVLTGGGTGITQEQIARLLPALPAEGERNQKGIRFEGNTLGWYLFDYLTRSEFRNYKPHTPERGDTLPAHLLPQGTFILQKTSHWSDKFYTFYPVSRQITVSGRSIRDVGTIEIPLSGEWTVFESNDNANPNIFSSTRVAGIVMRTFPLTDMSEGARWYPKIIMDKALFPSSGGSYDYSGLSIRLRTDFGSHFDTQLFKTSFDTDDSTGTVQEIVASGKTYVCFRPNPLAIDSRIIFDNAVNNGASLSFQILKSKTASPTFPPTDPQFLSDDPATAWVDGDEFETGLYEGDANGHPQARILPPVDVWNHVVARSNTYFSGTSPDARAGVDGQFWVNLRTGQIHQKQSGTWTLITDVALQTEISRAIEWSGIANNTSIPANFMTKHSNRYFGAKLQHIKTSGSTAPTGDTTNWIELSNEVTTGTSAVAVEWSSIPQNQSVPLGTIVKHGNYTYMCITVHNRRGNGPDSDAGNWQLLTNYQGVWSQGYYHAGAITVQGTGVYLALHTVNNTDPAPNASTNVKWLQINNVEPPARYIELTVNTGLSVAAETAAAVPLTYASTLAKSNENTGVLTRNSAGNAIDLAAGTYTLDTHIVIDPGTNDKRANFTIQIYEGSNLLDEKTYLNYSRARAALAFESVTSHHIFTLSASRTIQVRIKFADREAQAEASTAAGGTVIIKKE